MPTLFNKNNMIILSFYFIIFFTVVFLTSHQLSGHNYASDLSTHILFIEPLFEGSVYIPHPLWHIAVHYMTYITLDVKSAATIVNALFVVMWIYIVQMIYIYFVGKEKKNNYTYVFLFIIFIIGPAYIPFLTKYIIAGTGSPNIWNSATLIAVKPFALLAVFFTILSLEKKHTYYYILSAISLLISIYAKPSFVIAFLPALILLMILKKFYSKENMTYVAILSLISIGSLGYQFLHTFGEDKTKIIISFLGVWSSASSNVLLSILLAILFPLFYLIFNLNKVKENNYLVLTWFMTFISIIYAAFLAEEGDRFYHGNFFWSYMISLSLLYVFTLIDYFKNITDIKPYIKIFLNIVLLWQVFVGLYYFIAIIMTGGDPAGVVDFSNFLK